jgi:hypothetical protein
LTDCSTRSCQNAFNNNDKISTQIGEDGTAIISLLPEQVNPIQQSSRKRAIGAIKKVANATPSATPTVLRILRIGMLDIYIYVLSIKSLIFPRIFPSPSVVDSVTFCDSNEKFCDADENGKTLFSKRIKSSTKHQRAI